MIVSLPHQPPGARGEDAATIILFDLAELGIEPEQLCKDLGSCHELVSLEGEHLGYHWTLFAGLRCLQYVVTPTDATRNGEPIASSSERA